MPDPPWAVLAIAGEFLVKLTMVFVVLLRRRARPAASIAWIVVILAVPLVGIVAYVLVGNVRLGRARIDRHRDITRRVMETALRTERAEMSSSVEPEYRHLVTLVETVGGFQIRGGNAMRLIADTDLLVQSLVEDIDTARQHCHLLFYIFHEDHSGTRIADALIRAAKRGVQCRLLVDDVGSRAFLRSKLRTAMDAAGVHVLSALPVNTLRVLFARVDLRNHRKLAVVDGSVGYTGSHNIADADFAVKRKFAPWVDAMVRVEGPIARDLQILFVQDWFLDSGEPLDHLLEETPPAIHPGAVAQLAATGPNSFNEALRHLMHVSLHAAREELVLTTPYFVPDDATAIALATAAHRGVETSLVVPARNDSPLVAAASRSHYESLLEPGVRVYEYEPGLLHAKTLTVDRTLAMIGTANMDRRSFELNFEITLVVYDDDFASQLRFLQRSYIADSREVSLQQWRRRRLATRLWHNAAGILSPLL